MRNTDLDENRPSLWIEGSLIGFVILAFSADNWLRGSWLFLPLTIVAGSLLYRCRTPVPAWFMYLVTMLVYADSIGRIRSIPEVPGRTTLLELCICAGLIISSVIGFNKYYRDAKAIVRQIGKPGDEGAFESWNIRSRTKKSDGREKLLRPAEEPHNAQYLLTPVNGLGRTADVLLLSCVIDAERFGADNN